MSLLAFVVALTLLVSAFCSLLEATLYSTRIATLEAAAKTPQRRPAALRFLQMKNEIAVPTSAILILNTIANTAGATVAGMFAAQVLGAGWVPIFSIALTLSILFFSEILPKTFGATHWRTIWAFIVWPLAVIERALYPLIRITQRFAQMFTPKDTPAAITADEILAMIHVGAKTGHVAAFERRMLDAVFHLDTLLCRQVMVPRSEVVFLDADSSPAEWLAEAKRSQHSRYPVCRGSFDEVVGILVVRDLVGLDTEKPIELDSLLRPARHVPETKRIKEILTDMQRSKQHMAIVVDEHGSSTGIITLENVIEKVVGSIQDEFDAETPNIIAESRTSYMVKGATPLDQINRELSTELRSANVDTLSGYLVAQLGRLLAVGDHVDIPGMTAEVVEIEGNRATKIRLKRASKKKADELEKEG